MARVLSQKYLLLVGLASYSIYLLHQPVLVFVHKSDVLSEIPFNSTITIIFIILIGIAMQRHIERPFRDQKLFDRSSIFIISSVILFLIVLFGAVFASTGIHKKSVMKNTTCLIWIF